MIKDLKVSVWRKAHTRVRLSFQSSFLSASAEGFVFLTERPPKRPLVIYFFVLMFVLSTWGLPTFLSSPPFFVCFCFGLTFE